MGEKIAVGFHTCMDFELEWSKDTIENLIRKYQIQDSEIMAKDVICSEREMVIASLDYMKSGTGGEMVPKDPKTCVEFANNFHYEITIGGTATRAAMAIQKIGYSSVVHMCCFNEEMKKRLPKGIRYISSVGVLKTKNPHVVLQYPSNTHILANDIDFVTPRENRVMYSNDIEGIQMKLTEGFIPLIQDAEVFLLSCFSEVLDFQILEDRINTTKKILKSLPSNAIVVMEDGDYVVKKHREYVHRELKDFVDILSMNEDELQTYIGQRINILNPDEVLNAVKHMHEFVHIRYILIHSSKWALLYGENPGFAKQALESGVAMSATRFRIGDIFAKKDFEESKVLASSEESTEFCRRIAEIGNGHICCVPAKDLTFVEKPTSVGLGDYFAGGLLPKLTSKYRQAL
ncbi:ADP-dependent glucokinase/phosphofructokinase [Lachnospiraceae bacterium ZAX-1]